MPLKSPSQAVTRRKLPEAVPGTPEQLAGIARRIVDPRARGRLHDGKARLQSMADRLGRLGHDLLHGLQQQITSPSAEALEAELKRVRRQARALVKTITGLPPFARDPLNDAYWAQRRWDPGTRSFQDLGIGTAPAVVAASAIAAAADQHLDGWQKGTVVGRVPPERRGPMRVYQRIIGDPRTFVAEQVAQLVIAEQGAAAATAEESGVVYVVVGELWEWATGLSDEEANLRKHIRQGVRHGQLVAAQSKVQTDIEDEVTRYQVSLAEAPPSEARREHKQRLRALQAKQDRLTRKLLGSEPLQDEPNQGQQEQDKPG